MSDIAMDLGALQRERIRELDELEKVRVRIRYIDTRIAHLMAVLAAQAPGADGEKK